ncbi:nucleotidyltransferase domain-containing protein [Holophaga foetida]|uniref:nucleotidyltransferase domain-containing protein n=1 Tax=Holophaga foetida TaxID=35839 RepID=UPI000247425A|nr:nucleotidyltransferase domain-containing protein [Holophaga foetida]
MIPQSVLDTLVERVVQAVKPRRIILFGSAARDEMGLDSDLDVLVIMADGARRRDVSAQLYRALRRFGCAIDVVVATENDVLTQQDNPGMVYQRALAEGRELYHAA